MGHAHEDKVNEFKRQTPDCYNNKRSGGYALTGKASQAAKEGATAYIHGDELEVEGVEGIKHVLDGTDVEDADTVHCTAVKGINQCAMYGFSDTTGNEDIEDEGFFVGQNRKGENYLIAARASELHNAIKEVGMENTVKQPEEAYNEITR